MQFLPVKPISAIRRYGSVLLTLGSLGVFTLPSVAVQLANGSVHFDSVPIFKEARTTISNAHATGATYYFRLTVPPNAGESLKHVDIAQTEGFETIEFNLRRTRAALNKRKGPVIPLEAVSYDETGAIRVTFAEPVQPGNDVVIGLRPYYNPEDGIYLFGVSATPDGAIAQPQFIGHGRIHFFDRFF